MKILLTAFDPFGGGSVNSAQAGVAGVRDGAGGAEIVKLTVPTVFDACIPAVMEAVERERPDAVLCIGMAGDRRELTPERIAINVDDARIPDNAGCQPVDRPVVEGGPAAFFSTLPVREMAETIRRAGLPASISYSAGTFVCNHLMYGVLYEAAAKYPAMRAGFMHVPALRSPGTDTGMEAWEITRGIEAALEAVAAAGPLCLKGEPEPGTGEG